MQKKTDWKHFKNVLCIRVDNIGDVLMTAPAIIALKESVPGRKITLMTSRTGSSIAQYIPEVDDLIEFDPVWEKNDNGNSSQAIYDIVEKVKKNQFEAAVIFTVYSQNPLPAALLCYLAGIPKVAGYCRENPYHLITDWLPDREPLYEIKHEVTRQLDLVKMLGATVENSSFTLAVAESTTRNVTRKLSNFGIRVNEPWLIIHPGVSEKKRQYPVELFAEAARKIILKLGYQVVITGLEHEKELGDYIAGEGDNAFNLAGKLTLKELIATIRLAPVLIANNTGPVHISAAVQTPVVVLYALTNPQHAPWNIKHIVLPFEVPLKVRSKNTIINYANEKSFRKSPGMVKPDEIINAVKNLVSGNVSYKQTKMVMQ